MIDDKKISAKYFCILLNNHNFKKEFCEIINKTITCKTKAEEYYFVKRETLKILIKILSKEELFSKFRDFYLSGLENLKMVMGLMNHTCVRIKFKAIQLLYFFFIDLDLREKNVCVFYRLIKTTSKTISIGCRKMTRIFWRRKRTSFTNWRDCRIWPENHKNK